MPSCYDLSTHQRHLAALTTYIRTVREYNKLYGTIDVTHHTTHCKTFTNCFFVHTTLAICGGVSQLHSSIWEDPIRDLGINLVLRIAADVPLKRVW